MNGMELYKYRRRVSCVCMDVHTDGIENKKMEGQSHYQKYKGYWKTERGKEVRKRFVHSLKGKVGHKRRITKWSQKQRIILINQLGNKCVKCGFTDIRALQIDHINGGGNKEVKSRGNAVLNFLYYNKHTEEAKNRLQVLCANCNWIKRFELEECRRGLNLC